MRTRLVLVSAAAAMIAAGVGPALAAGNAQSGPTVGDCISDGIYGNEPNQADGSAGGPAEQAPGDNAGGVLGSQSPGPFVTLPDGSVVRGSSVGDFQQTYGGGSVPAFCRAATR